MGLQWHGETVIEQIAEEVHRCSVQLFRELFDRIVVRISVAGPPPSAPGDPPRIDSESLIAGFVLEYTKGTGKYMISNPHEYAIYLEMGTYKMSPRPYLFSAISYVQANADSILAHPQDPVNSGYTFKDVAMLG